ncbi:DUF1616 domain-containing protein [Natronococcus sp.]|uniref:DUF1616 domain-containing protein n=1 Tax=Natronococcus sp. TaxID=35747 RepID=UPI0025D59620|nr:DUF1616 domain-containing protein [Natronococcus sp.]
MSDSDWWFFDLALVIAATGFVTFGLFTPVSGAVRVLLGIPLLLFLPGYAFIAVLYPDTSEAEYRAFDDETQGSNRSTLNSGGLQPIERFVLSIVASTAIVPAVALVATVTPWGITILPVLAGTALVTIVLSLAGIVQRYRCPPNRRYTPSVSGSTLLFSNAGDSFGRSDPSARPYNVMFLAALLVLAAVAGFAVASPPDHDSYTEFYLETEEVDGDTEYLYDESLSAGETESVTAYIANEEHEERSYETAVALQDVNYDNDSVSVNDQDVLTTDSVTVAHGETHEQTLAFEPTMTGDDVRLVLFLYEGEAPDDPDEESAYRMIKLPVTVS